MPEKKAQIILELAQAIGDQLGMSELLAALNAALSSCVHFDATTIMLLEGDTISSYCAHAEGFARLPGESLEVFVDRYASTMKVEPPPLKLSVSQYPISEMMKSATP